MRPLVDLAKIQIDVKVAEKIPMGLALYYLALPMTDEEDCATVVMAHPENVTALARLRTLLQREIVPYQGTPDEIRAAIARIYPQSTLPAHKILAWHAQPDQAAAVTALAALFGEALATTVSTLAATSCDLATVLATAYQDRFTLTVMCAPEIDLETILKASSTPLLFARGEVEAVRRVLVVMRGFSSDPYTLDWIVPLLRHTGAAVTLMPLLPTPTLPLNQVLKGNNPVWSHLERCLQLFHTHAIQPTLCWKEGRAPQQQIAEEYAHGNYDLLVIPAEGEGEFVRTVLAAVDRHPTCAQRPILVLKPIHG